MTYYINVSKTNISDFIQIIQSLKNLGVIESYDSLDSVVKEGEPLSTNTLESILETSREEISVGNKLDSSEVKKQIENWKKQ